MDDRINDHAWLASEYKTKSIPQIANILGCSAGAVLLRFIKFNIPRRPPEERLKGRHRPPEFGKIISEKARKRWAALGKMPDEIKMKVSKNRRRTGIRTGYKQVYTPETRYIAEHRYLMQQKLGRKLESYEHVHHIDGNKLNNSLDNLVVITNTEHGREHNVHRKRNAKGQYT